MRFSHESALQSCRVTKDLVTAIEAYLVSRLSALADSEEDKQALAKELKVSVTDSFGTEQLASIAEYSRPRFADDTSRVVIKLSSPYSTHFEYFEFEVQFDRQKIHSKVRFTFEGANPREFVIGVEKGVKDCVATESNTNHLFHPPAALDGALWAIAPILPWLDGLAFKFHTALGAVAVALTACLYAYTFLAKRMRPYITFDSNASEKQDKLWSWFVGGFSSFLVFTTLFASFRDAIISSLSK